MLSPVVQIHVDGQFDDAPEDAPEFSNSITTGLYCAPDFNFREGHTFIDDPLLQWSDAEDENEGEYEEAQTEDSEMDDEDWDTRQTSVDHEDWEIAERDFTKQYNRLRQHIAVRTGNVEAQKLGPAQSSASPHRTVPLPAVNRHRESPLSSTPQRTTDQLAALSKYAGRISQIDHPYGHMGIATSRKDPSERANMKDKSDRATNEQVLDPRTRLILFKMIGRGLISEVNGVVSTGKEANVYHALTPEKRHIALKIFKTSILTFKDRDRYVAGERRFRRGYGKHNPRKMVRLWAEKEMRNLKRLVSANIPCPEPIEVRENVLVMGFLGDAGGWASPRLKDADIPEDQLASLYKCLLLTIRKMYQQCKLVHADLSEYNILYHQSQLFIIDVGQSVEQDHASAFDFLRSDLKNVEEFFARRGVTTAGVRQSFEFVISDISKNNNDELWFEKCLEQAKTNSIQFEDEKQVDEKIFMQSYIPRTLNEVYNPERDVDLINEGRGQSLIYSGIIGVVTATDGMAKVRISDPEEYSAECPLNVVDEEEEEEDINSLESSNEEEERGKDQGESGDEDPSRKEKPLRGHRNEDKQAKKARKKAVKEVAKEKRKNKMPKGEKKRRVKTTRF